MDVQVVAIAVAIVVVIVLLLLAFLLCGARETTFEEAYGDTGVVLFDSSGNKKDGKAKGNKKHKEPHKWKKETKPAAKDAEAEKYQNQNAYSAAVERDEVMGNVDTTDQNSETSTASGKQQNLRNRKQNKNKAGKGEKREPSVDEKEIVPKVVHPLGGGDEHPQDPEVNESFSDEQAGVSESHSQEEKENLPSNDTTKKNKKKGGKGKGGKSDADSTKIHPSDEASVPNLQPVTVSEPDVEGVIERLRESSNLEEVDLSIVVECLLTRQEYILQMKKSEEDLGKLKKDLAEKERRYQSELRNVQDFNHQIRELRSDYESEKTKCVAIEKTYRSELNNMKGQLETAKNECARMKQTAAQNFQHSQQFQAQLQTLQMTNNQLQQELGQWKQRFEAMTTEHYQEKQRLNAELNSAKQQAHVSEEGRREIEVTLKHTHQQQAAAPKEDKQKEVEDLEKKLSAKEEEAKRTEKQLGELKREFTELEKAVLQLREDKRKTEERLEAANQSRAEIISANQKQPEVDPKLAKEVESLRQDLRDVKASNDKLGKHLEEAGKKRDHFQKALEDLESVLQHEKTERKRAEDKETETRKQLDAQDKEYKKKMESMEKEKASLLASMMDKEGKAESSRHKEVEVALNAKNRLEADVAELNKQLNAAKAQCGSFEKELSAVKKNLDSSENQCSELEKSQDSVRREMQAALMQRKAAEAEIENMKIEIQALQQTASTATMNGVKEESGNLKSPSKQRRSEPVQNGVTENGVDKPDRHETTSHALATVLFEWTKPAESVVLAGSFSGWEPTVVMKRGESCFWAQLELEPGTKYEFKFVVNDQWVVSDGYPRCVNPLGGENNYLEVSDYNSLNNEFCTVKDILLTKESVVENQQRELENLRAESKNRDRVLQDIASSLRKAQLANAEYATKLRELNQCKQTMSSSSEESALRSKIDELRTRNEQLFDAVKQTEKNTKDLVSKQEREWNSKLSEQEKLVRELLSKTFPDTPLPKQTQNYKEWLLEVERIVSRDRESVDHHTHTHSQTTIVKTETDAEAVRENAHLRAELNKYKGILSNVDCEMKIWESRAVEDEERWKKRCTGLEKELIKAKTSSVSVSTQQLNSTEEVKAQLSQLSVKLESEERERDRLREEIHILHKELETERATGRDLSTQAVKLRGMLKTGQDALKQEQELVNQLQVQLKAYQNGNGHKSVHSELDQLKSRLAEREQQLEKEMMVNKQLSNKLASLGLNT